MRNHSQNAIIQQLGFHVLPLKLPKVYIYEKSYMTQEGIVGEVGKQSLVAE